MSPDRRCTRQVVIAVVVTATAMAVVLGAVWWYLTTLETLK